MPDCCSIGYCSPDNFSIDFPGATKATSPYRYGEFAEGELLGLKLPFDLLQVAALLEFLVEPDP